MKKIITAFLATLFGTLCLTAEAHELGHEEGRPAFGPAPICANGIVPLYPNEISLMKPSGCSDNMRLLKVKNDSVAFVVPEIAGIPHVSVTIPVETGERLHTVVRTGLGRTGHEPGIPPCSTGWMFAPDKEMHVSGRAYSAPQDLAGAIFSFVAGTPMFIFGEYEPNPVGGLQARIATLLHRYDEMDIYIDQPLGHQVTFRPFGGKTCGSR